METNLSLYKIFYITADLSSISKAAEALFISQPAISKAIKKLEQSLSATLFVRTSKGVHLTEDGTMLYEHVKHAFWELELGERQLRRNRELGTGQLTIGVSSTLCKFILLPCLERFIPKYPHIKISIKCQSTNQTLRLLLENKIDIGLIGRPDSVQAVHFISIGKIEDTFVCTKSYLDNLLLREGKETINPFLCGTLMLLDNENITRQYINQYLSAYEIASSHLVEVTSIDLLIEFAKTGLGIACVIKDFVQKELAAKELIELPFPQPIQKREIGFGFPKNIPPTGPMNYFIAHYQSYAGSED